MTEIRPLSNDTAALWCCSICKASGIVTFPEHTDVCSVVEAISSAHQDATPKCTNTVEGLRVTRPESWFRDACELYGGSCDRLATH